MGVAKRFSHRAESVAGFVDHRFHLSHRQPHIRSDLLFSVTEPGATQMCPETRLIEHSDIFTGDAFRIFLPAEANLRLLDIVSKGCPRWDLRDRRARGVGDDAATSALILKWLFAGDRVVAIRDRHHEALFAAKRFDSNAQRLIMGMRQADIFAIILIEICRIFRRRTKMRPGRMHFSNAGTINVRRPRRFTRSAIFVRSAFKLCALSLGTAHGYKREQD